MLYINETISIGYGKPTFIIAEVGQNHQGNFNTAKELIRTAKDIGADCVKFQKTNLSEKFNEQALNRKYDGANSWGTTYGEHKTFLEFSNSQFIELQNFAKELGILFTASPMDLVSLQFLIDLKVPFIKIGSGDANNFLMIDEAAKHVIPLIISTGMQTFDTVKEIYKTVVKYHKNLVLMHCVSAYPSPIEDINLKVLKLYQHEFSDISIGYSGHEIGIDISIAAVAIGARVIERHITLDKTQKGSDHKCSLEPNEFKEMITKIRNVEIAMGQSIKGIQKSEMKCYEKLGKTLVAAYALKKGHRIELNDLKIKVAEPKGIDGSKHRDMIGKVLQVDVEKDQSILEEYVN